MKFVSFWCVSWKVMEHQVVVSETFTIYITNDQWLSSSVLEGSNFM